MDRPAITLKGVAKRFKKRTIRREYTTLKTELVRLLTFQRKATEAAAWIEALQEIDLTVARGQTVGIIGRNGSGKSTLLKLITGIYQPSAGTVEVDGRISALLELGAGFHPDFTGRENILINGIILGMKRAEVKARMPEIIAFAELGDFIDEPVRTYSSGMFMRLAFAVATHVDPDILIIDEILAVGDEHFQRKSRAKMEEFKGSGRTIVLVTHDLGSVLSWCDSAVWIDGGRVREQGEAKRVVESYRRAVQRAEEEAERTGTSALSAPGAPLPAEPTAEAGPSALVRLRGLRLEDPAGQSLTTAASEAPLTVVVDFEAEGSTPLSCHVELKTEAGQLLFGAAQAIDRVGAGRGRVRLEVERLGLGSGQYRVEARLEVSGGGAAEKRSATFAVLASGEVQGPLRPPHRWLVETVGSPAQGHSGGEGHGA